MQIRKTVRLVNGIYHSEVSLGDNAISPTESQAIAQFGPVTIDSGGTVIANAQTVILPARVTGIPDGLPIKQTFALADSTQAEALAHAWAETIKDRISVALHDILMKDAGVTGTTEENVLPTPGDRRTDDLQTSDWMNLSI